MEEEGTLMIVETSKTTEITETTITEILMTIVVRETSIMMVEIGEIGIEMMEMEVVAVAVVDFVVEEVEVEEDSQETTISDQSGIMKQTKIRITKEITQATMINPKVKCQMNTDS